MQPLYRLFIVLSMLMLILNACVKTVTETSLFYPRAVPVFSDEIYRENITLIASDSTTLNGWWLHSPKYKRSMLYFYGNGDIMFASIWFLTNLATKTESNSIG